MSKLYNNYLELKKDRSDCIYLFKSGIFYIALQEDANILSKKFGFKITNLNTNVIKCGFPTVSLEKYTNLFTSNNIDFKIIDSNLNTSFFPYEYTQNIKTKELLEYINTTNHDNLSISEAYSFIGTVKNKVEEILKLKG